MLQSRKMDTHSLKSIQSQALYNAIKEYESNKWKVIGQKLGKPAKVCHGYFPSRDHLFKNGRPASNTLESILVVAMTRTQIYATTIIARVIHKGCAKL